MTIKKLLLRIINNEKLPERIIYDGRWYDLHSDRNYYWFEDIDGYSYCLFDDDIFEHLNKKIKAIWKLDKVE